MPSTLKSETARINGAKSKGPKTAATREKSSQNALRHGFTSHSTVLLQCEDPALFQELHNDYFGIYKPETPAEQVLVDEMTVLRWRIQRLWTVEIALYDREIKRERAEAQNPADRLAESFISLTDESRSLSLLSRYESRLHRMHDRTYRTLRQLQQERHQQPQPEPDPPPELAATGPIPPEKRENEKRENEKRENESNPRDQPGAGFHPGLPQTAPISSAPVPRPLNPVP